MGDIIYYNFVASMDPESHDKWRAYACEPAEVAERVVKFLPDQERNSRLGEPDVLPSLVADPGMILVGRAA